MAWPGPGTGSKMIYYQQKPIDLMRDSSGAKRDLSPVPASIMLKSPVIRNYKEGDEDIYKCQVTGVPDICSALLPTVSTLCLITYDVLPLMVLTSLSLPTCILPVHLSENSSTMTSSMSPLWTTDFFKTFSSGIIILNLCLFHHLASTCSTSG